MSAEGTMPTTITREQFDLARQFTVGDIRREVELAKAWLGRLTPSGTYEIVVEKYLDDFAAAVERLSNDPSLVFPLTRA
jgi:hypothetical protein